MDFFAGTCCLKKLDGTGGGHNLFVRLKYHSDVYHTEEACFTSTTTFCNALPFNPLSLCTLVIPGLDSFNKAFSVPK